MSELKEVLVIHRCPHCRVDSPMMTSKTGFKTTAHDGSNQRDWKAYVCARCGGAVLATANHQQFLIRGMYPDASTVNEAIPLPARSYLQQALDTIHAPAGSVMLSASAVDAMLKDKGYKDGVLNTRIKQAAADHLITENMAKWAHEVRLDANDQRHADENATLPTPEDAKKSVDFALALAEFLFVLPSRVTRGLDEAKEEKTAS